MGAMFFGQYLLSKGIISREALIDAIELQRRSNLSLPELADKKGYMSEGQQAAILARYRTSDADLETLCLETGLVDREQLDELIAIQRSDWVRIGGALVESGHLTVDDHGPRPDSVPVQRHLPQVFAGHGRKVVDNGKDVTELDFGRRGG